MTGDGVRHPARGEGTGQPFSGDMMAESTMVSVTGQTSKLVVNGPQFLN